MRAPRYGVRVIAVLVLLAANTPSQATAQEPDVQLDVSVDEGWFGTDRPLRLVVRARSAGTDVPDTRLSVAIGDRLLSRSDLRAALARTAPVDPIHAFTVSLPDLAADERREMTIMRPASELGAFLGAPDGLYPLSVTVRTSTGPALATVTTAITYLRSQPPKPLRLLPILAVIPEPSPVTGDDGVATTAGSVRTALRGAATSDGAIAVAASPVTLDQLDDDVAAALADVPAEMVLDVPYTNAVLAHLGALGAGAVAEQLEMGRRRLASLTGARPSKLLYPPGFAVDEDTLDLAGASGVEGVLVDGNDLADSATTPAVTVRNRGVVLVPVDRALHTVASTAVTDVDVTDVVAEAAMIYFEAPGRTRALAMVVDHQAPRAVDILRAAAGAPWADVTTPGEMIEAAAVDRPVSFPAIEDPPAGYLSALRRARSAVADLRSLTEDDNTLRTDVGTAFRAAAGTAWWTGAWPRGTSYADTIARAVGAQRELISASGQAVTFTSRSGEVPIIVSNDTGYPVRVRIEVSSPRLEFPQGATRVIDPLPPPGQTVTFPALASGSGTFPLTVRLTSLDGRVLVSTDQIVVRSLAVNASAVVLTVGGAVFLALWYGRRVFRRRREG